MRRTSLRTLHVDRRDRASDATRVPGGLPEHRDPLHLEARVEQQRPGSDEGAGRKYPEAGHNVWTIAYAEPELAGWLFTQTR
jgi:predicted peptidase